MSADNVAYNSRIYTDIQGLAQLKYEKNSAAATKEVSKQFEALLMQMVMHSMRDANKAFSSGLFGSNQMEFYQDMFDKQLALMLPQQGLGFAEMVEKNISGTSGTVERADVPLAQPIFPAASVEQKVASVAQLEQPQATSEPATTTFSTQKEFIKKLWPAAKLAAKTIGTTPGILLAQAALETNWGKSILPQSNNLFNIKAGSTWSDKTTTVASLEQRNGVLVKEKSDFRSYDSYEQSFQDYAKLITQNDRYSQAVSQAQNPEQFTHALQKAGFATDEKYAHKIMQIFSSQTFKDLIADMDI